MPTIAALRRRGFPAEGVRDFATAVGVAKADNVIEIQQLEYAVRNVLNRTAPRRFGVLDPIKVVIENYPEGEVETFSVANNPEDPGAGSRDVEFSRELFIEREDFMEDPAPKFFRLAPGREVRLRGAYFITCESVVKGSDGKVVELRCKYDPATPRRRCARRKAAQGRRSTGCRRRMRFRLRFGFTTTSSARPHPARTQT